MTDCSVCQAPSRQLWPPVTEAPHFQDVHVGNWIELMFCPACQQLWCSSPYEPYAAFTYAVIWNYSEADWLKVHSGDNGEVLLQWHKAKIQSLYPTLDTRDKQAVQAHQTRSKGFYCFDAQTLQVPELNFQ